jgi:hypothetical protein
MIRLSEPIAPLGPLRSGSELEVPPRPGPLPAPAPQRPSPRRPRVGWIAFGAVFMALGLAVLVLIVVRNEAVARWPATARLYALVGLPVAAPGLVLDKITPARTAEGLVIEGDITNPGNTAREVPRLRVALRDPAQTETQFKVIDPPAARLGPGETAHFITSFDHPDEGATGVVVTFADH